MEIISLGHAGFRLRGKETTLVIDPAPPEFGGSLKGITADIVCVSHPHHDHAYVEGVGGSPYIVKGPGEYEIKGVLITGIRTFHDDKHGEERGGNTIYIIHMDDIVICHLGDLGHPLIAHHQQQIGGADILMIPVGGNTTINAAQAAEIVGEVEPAVTIPMHYGTPILEAKGIHLDPLDIFFNTMGASMADPVNRFIITRSNIPTEPQIVVLTAKG